VKSPQLFGWSLGSGDGFYFLCLVVAVLSTLGILNLLRSPTGRAFVAIRDSEISAQSMGIHLARYKTMSFAISAALAGLARRAVRAQAELHLAGPVQHPAVDRPAADGGDRRAGLGARRVPGRDLPDRDAAADLDGQGLAAGGRRAGAGAAGSRLRHWC
jgi:hypothetical protein